MRHVVIALLLACAVCAPGQATGNVASSATLQDFTGQYVLQDGRVLTVTQRRHRLTAQVEGRAGVPLTATGPATFAAPGGELLLTFDQRSNGNVAAVTVTQPAQPVGQAKR